MRIIRFYSFEKVVNALRKKSIYQINLTNSNPESRISNLENRFESRIPNLESWKSFRIPNPESRILKMRFESRIPNLEYKKARIWRIRDSSRILGFGRPWKTPFLAPQKHPFWRYLIQKNRTCLIFVPIKKFWDELRHYYCFWRLPEMSETCWMPRNFTGSL